jgi:hypothetical protein
MGAATDSSAHHSHSAAKSDPTFIALAERPIGRLGPRANAFAAWPGTTPVWSLPDDRPRVGRDRLRYFRPTGIDLLIGNRARPSWLASSDQLAMDLRRNGRSACVVNDNGTVSV